MSNQDNSPGKVIRGRGLGVKPALVHVNLRVPRHVLEFFQRSPNYTAAMRKVLTEYAENPPNP
jgi:hypothetical protein